MSAPVIHHFEAKLYALRKSKDGTIVSWVVHPHDDVAELINLRIGSVVNIAWTLEDDKPVEVEPIEVKGPKAALARGAEKPKRKFADMSLPEQCGVRCSDGRFQRFFLEVYDYPADPDRTETEMVTSAVRRHVGVNSRSELSTNHDAANRWRKLESEFQQWLTDETYKEVAR